VVDTQVTLINPPSPYLANDASYPPMGLLYLGARLEELGHAVKIVDFTGGADWRKQVESLEGDVFGLPCVTPNFKIVQEISHLLPSDKPIIVGNVHATFLPEDILRNVRCDAVVKGESEVVIEKVMKDIENGTIQRVYDGGLVPVESIPKPARHLVDLHKYMPGGENATPIYTSRGCPFACRFCSKISGRTYREMPISRVIEEIEIVKSLGFQHVVFGDDNIIVNPKRVKELLKHIKPLGITFRLNQDARARTLDEEMLELAKDAGCSEISFGIEHGSQTMLDNMNKDTTVEANKRAITLTQKHGMKAKAYFIVNFPGETEKTAKETVAFVEKTRPDKWLLSAFAPLPGSDTFAYPEKYGITWVSRNWEDYYLVGKDGSFRPCFQTDELSFSKQVYLHDLVHGKLKQILG